MNRRSFLKALIAVPVAAVVAAKTQPSPPLRERMAVRFITNHDMQSCVRVNRFDVIYGYACWNPNFPVRVAS